MHATHMIFHVWKHDHVGLHTQYMYVYTCVQMARQSHCALCTRESFSCQDPTTLPDMVGLENYHTCIIMYMYVHVYLIGRYMYLSRRSNVPATFTSELVYILRELIIDQNLIYVNELDIDLLVALIIHVPLPGFVPGLVGRGTLNWISQAAQLYFPWLTVLNACMHTICLDLIALSLHVHFVYSFSLKKRTVLGVCVCLALFIMCAT